MEARKYVKLFYFEKNTIKKVKRKNKRFKCQCDVIEGQRKRLN